jgi:hypothetical protein
VGGYRVRLALIFIVLAMKKSIENENNLRIFVFILHFFVFLGIFLPFNITITPNLDINAPILRIRHCEERRARRRRGNP